MSAYVSTKGCTPQEETEIIKMMKERGMKQEVLLIVCPEPEKERLHKFAADNEKMMIRPEGTVLSVITGDTPNAALLGKFNPVDVSWILFCAEPAYMNAALHQIKQIWGDRVFARVVQSVRMTNILGVVDTRCSCPGDKICCGLKKVTK